MSAGGAKFLLDCGLFQGYKQLRLRNWTRLPLDPRALAAKVLHGVLDRASARAASS